MAKVKAAEDSSEEFDLDWLGETQKPSEMGDPKMIAVYGSPGCGKGHPYGTPVLTETGWVPVEELTVGSTVIGSNGAVYNVYGVYDRGELPVFNVTLSDGASVSVDATHLWLVANKKGRKQVLDTQEILNNWDIYGKHHLSVPPAPKCQLAHNPNLPLDPYVLGALLADGYLHGASIDWTKNSQAVADTIRDRATANGFVLRESTSATSTARHWRLDHPDDGFHKSVILDTIRSLNLNVPSGEKFIPEEYLASSVEQRTALLGGLFDGDGSLDHRGNAKYSTTSTQLAHDVLALCWSLGVAAHLTRNRNDGTLIVQIQDDFDPFVASELRNSPRFKPHRSCHIVRRIVSIEPVGMAQVRCIAVTAPDQLYVTKDYIVTHNSYLAASISEVEGYYPVLIIDTEESTVGTIANFPDERITIRQVDNAADFDKLIANLINKEHPFKTVIIDTMGNAMDRKEWAIMANPPKTQSGADDTQKAWGLLYSWAKKVVDGLRSADFATVLIFHEKEEKDSVGNNYSRVWINGAAKKYVPSKPDLFGLLVSETDDDAGKTERTIYFGADTSRATKSRFENLGLPSKVKNPTMSEIIETIREARKNQEA